MDDECLTLCRVVTFVGLLGPSDRALVRHAWCGTAIGEMKAMLGELKLIFLFERMADFVPTILAEECQEWVKSRLFCHVKVTERYVSPGESPTPRSVQF